MGKSQFFMSGFKGDDPWVDNEMLVRERGVVRDGAMQQPTEVQGVQGKKIRTIRKNASLGLEGRDIHISGTRVTTLGEVPDGKGGVTWYGQAENGGTFKQHWEQTKDGRMEPSEKPRRTYGGF